MLGEPRSLENKHVTHLAPRGAILTLAWSASALVSLNRSQTEQSVAHLLLGRLVGLATVLDQRERAAEGRLQRAHNEIGFDRQQTREPLGNKDPYPRQFNAQKRAEKWSLLKVILVLGCGPCCQLSGPRRGVPESSLRITAHLPV